MDQNSFDRVASHEYLSISLYVNYHWIIDPYTKKKDKIK